MASEHKGLEDQKVLSQLVACLVSMGYQVNQCIMDSWNYGSCQRRSRIILTIAASGLEPISQKPHTHSRSYEETEGRCLGKLPNGERFGDREHYATPFPYVSAQEATEDLPDIGNGNVQTCVQFPDHRLSRPSSVRDRKLLECIPMYPPGSGYNQAVQLGLVPPALRTGKKETEKSYQRIEADDLIPTITTAICIQDSRNGASVHWLEPRPLSIHDARRTQGIPDEEPIIGTLSQQWKTIGNGVDRKVSFSIGLALRDAFSRSRRTSSTSSALQVEAGVEMIVDAEGEAEETIVDAVDEAEEMIVDIEDDPIPRLSTETDLTATGSLRKTSSSSLAASSTRSLSSVASSNRQSKVETDAATNGFFMARPLRTAAADIGRLSLPTIPVPLRLNQPAAPRKRPREGVQGLGDASDIAGARSSSIKRVKVIEKRRTTSPATFTKRDQTRGKGRWTSVPPLEVPIRTRGSGPAEYAPKAWNKKIGISQNIVRLP
jgi:site-specific DNA-cytosine methylase